MISPPKTKPAFLFTNERDKKKAITNNNYLTYKNKQQINKKKSIYIYNKQNEKKNPII